MIRQPLSLSFIPLRFMPHKWVGYAKRKQKQKEYIRGWVGYYHLANMKRLLLETDEWLRRQIRMCIWKAWKKVKTKVANLIRCGINKP